MKHVFALLLIFTAAVFINAQEYDPAGDFMAVTINSGRSVRINYYTGPNTEVNIPPFIRNLPVTYIGEESFAGEGLTEVKFPDSITHIGDGAFTFNRLTDIAFGGNVLIIGAGAFDSNQLTSVIIPDSVTQIKTNAFANNKLTKITIGTNVVFELPYADQYYIDESSYFSFPEFYHGNECKAGTYIFNDGKWNYNPQ